MKTALLLTLGSKLARCRYASARAASCTCTRTVRYRTRSPRCANSVQVHAEPTFEAQMPESKRGVHAFDVAPIDTFQEHFSDFLDAVRARRQPVAGVDFGVQLMTPLLLGVNSYRESRMLNYDIRTQRVSDRATPRLGYEGNGRNHPEGRTRGA